MVYRSGTLLAQGCCPPFEEGEFIVVPHGVEHCPVVLSDTCEVVLVEPSTSRDKDAVLEERTGAELEQV